MIVARTIEELRRTLPNPGMGVLVPTMGALHEGHAALIRLGVREAKAHDLPGSCAVSIFVNPTQFNDPADFERYPRTLETDLELCRAAGAALVFAPSVEEMYPAGDDLPRLPVPEVARLPGLEDRSRPGHFEGVCDVVRRLFELVRPARAVFGEKDWQQLQVVRAMSRAESLGVEIVAHPTLREPDGLARSSRNRFLSPADRALGLELHRALRECASVQSAAVASIILQDHLVRAGVAPDYAVVRDAYSLMDLVPGRPGRALVAARVGPVRLLDNAPWPGPWNPAS